MMLSHNLRHRQLQARRRQSSRRRHCQQERLGIRILCVHHALDHKGMPPQPQPYGIFAYRKERQ